MRSRFAMLLWGALCLLGLKGYAQTPQFMWGQAIGSLPWGATVRTTAIDGTGNVYALIQSAGAFTVGPVSLPRRNDCLSQALVKYDSTGQLLWAKSVMPTYRSTGGDGALRQMGLDSEGNLFTAGTFDGYASAIPALIVDGDTILRNTCLGGFFIAKWAPDGQLIWLKTSRDTAGYCDIVLLRDMCIGPTGDVFVTGNVITPTGRFAVGNVLVPNSMREPWFVASLSGRTGETRWVRAPRSNPPVRSGYYHRREGRRITTDAAGNVYVLGYGSGFRIDSIRVPYAIGQTDTTFWVKFGPDGRAVAGRTLPTYPSYDLAADNAGNSFIGIPNWYSDSLSLSPVAGAPPQRYRTGWQSVLKLNAAGAIAWVKPVPGLNYSTYASSLTADGLGHLYCTGSYDTTRISIDGLALPRSRGPQDGYLLTLDAATGLAQRFLTVRGRNSETLTAATPSAVGQLAVGAISNSDSTVLGTELIYAPRRGYKAIVSRVSAFNNLLEGAVFVDTNRNNVQDDDEIGYPFGTVVKVMPGNRYFVPNEGGFYQAPVQLGTYAVSLAAVPLYHTAVNLPPNNTTFTTFGNEAPGRSVALRPIPGKQDLQVFLSSSIADKEAWSPVHLGLSYRNIGTVAIDSGTVTLAYDSLLTLQHSTTPADHHTGRTLTWKFRHLLPGQARHIGSDFELAGTALAGDTLRSHATLEPVTGDLTPADNRASVTEIVIDSFEADTTTVSFRQLSPQQAQAGQWLDYTLRFRNAAPDSVYRVTLRDTLPATLRLETVDVVGASHPFEWSLEPGDVLVVRLYGARLGGTANGRPGDEGFVHFRVKPQPGLVVGDLISNRATIYLDDQPPFTTAPASTTVQALVTGTSATTAAFGANVWPNPTTGTVQVAAFVPQAGPLTLRLWDATGRLALVEQYRAAAGNWQQSLDLHHLPAGLYLLDLQTPTAHLSRRLVVAARP